jgi:RNA polymerase sigma-70 factor (ECF subfamily)
MREAPATRPSLLVRIRDPLDEAAWAQFVDVYAPLIYGYARRNGLQDADAADLTQEVLRAVAAAAGRLEYDPRRGSFRGWLFTVVRNDLRTFLDRRRRQARAAGGTDAQRLLDQQPAPGGDPEALWQEEYERRLFRWAADRVRQDVAETTWQAFWQTAVEGRGAREAAGALGLSVAAVYMAKSRVLARLKELVREVHGDDAAD